MSRLDEIEECPDVNDVRWLLELVRDAERLLAHYDHNVRSIGKDYDYKVIDWLRRVRE